MLESVEDVFLLESEGTKPKCIPAVRQLREPQKRIECAKATGPAPLPLSTASCICWSKRNGKPESRMIARLTAHAPQDIVGEAFACRRGGETQHPHASGRRLGPSAGRVCCAPLPGMRLQGQRTGTRLNHSLEAFRRDSAADGSLLVPGSGKNQQVQLNNAVFAGTLVRFLCLCPDVEVGISQGQQNG